MALALLPCAAAAGQITPFTEEAVQRGLIYEMVPADQTLGYGAGVAIVDLNGNGLNDIIVMGRLDGQVGFFENNPLNPGQFIDRSFTTNGQGQPVAKHSLTHPSGIAIADFNGNGLLDVYITQNMNVNTGATYPSRLLRNEGSFNFTDIASSAGVRNMGNGEGAAWGDFDHDGWLDLYVANYGMPPWWTQQVHKNKLYRNLGNETFADVSVAQGIDDFGQGFTIVFSDVNRNGWLDLYLANDRGHVSGFSPNQLWMNNAGQYENACAESGACLGLWSMCVAAGDFNGNGYPDFYVTNIAHPSGYNGWNPLLVNHGDGTFTEECADAGVCQLITSWCGIFFDFDNNGWLDLYVCNQWAQNTLYANSGTWPAPQIASQANLGGGSGQSYNAAVGDVTGNGALDLLLNNLSGDSNPINVRLFINHEGAKRNFIRFKVVGTPGSANTHAIGANIEVTAAGHSQWREIYAGGNNYKAQSEPIFHFGLGNATVAEHIVVNWPALGGSRTLSNYPANHTWTIYPTQMLGDSNGDGFINVFDLLALLGSWGALQPGSEIMDLNGDGLINVFDLLALLGKWGPIQ